MCVPVCIGVGVRGARGNAWIGGLDGVGPKLGCVHINLSVFLRGCPWPPRVCAGHWGCDCAGLELMCVCISASVGGRVAATPG